MSDIIPGTTEYVAQNQVPDSSSPMIPIQKSPNIPEEKSPSRLPDSPWLPDEPENKEDIAVADEIDQMLKIRSANMNNAMQEAKDVESGVVPQVRPRTGVDTTPAYTPEGLLDPQKPTGWWKRLLGKK